MGNGRQTIAIVGIGCWFPGAVRAAEPQEIVAERKDVISVNFRGWDLADFDPDWDAGGVPRRRFPADADEFDQAFFRSPARKTLAMDPTTARAADLGGLRTTTGTSTRSSRAAGYVRVH